MRKSITEESKKRNMTIIKLNTKSATSDVLRYLKELARGIYAHHLDDDPSGVEWPIPPDPDTLKLLTDNRNALLNHERIEWTAIWGMYHTEWVAAKRDERVAAEVHRLLEQFGLVESCLDEDLTDTDALLVEEWTTSILDAMNQY